MASHTPINPDHPFVLSADTSGCPSIAALNAAAEAEGLRIGDQLADARAKTSFLQVRPIDPAADDAALRRLAVWGTRYTPAVSPFDKGSKADGFFLDITGAAHLFGGEEALLADLSRRLDRFGLPARLAVADSAGAAWALSRFHSERVCVLPAGQDMAIQDMAMLAELPIEALRLSNETCNALRRLGFKQVGALLNKPRAPFAARFPPELLLRLDQALGLASEPLALISPPPVYHSLRYLLEPIVSQDAIVAVVHRLMKDIAHALLRDGVGARALRLVLYRVDGDVAALDLGLATPTRDTAHVARLIELKLDRLTDVLDAGFGIEALGLGVTVSEPMLSVQSSLSSLTDETDPQQCAALIDRLHQRLGSQSVRRLRPFASHAPERADMRSTAVAMTVWPTPDVVRPRPLFVLPHAERADVIASVPGEPPRRFRWRGIVYDVAFVQGPERIASEWWRTRQPQPTRDYYLVEDREGRRFWLYREGLSERKSNASCWFVHGLFA